MCKDLEVRTELPSRYNLVFVRKASVMNVPD